MGDNVRFKDPERHKAKLLEFLDNVDEKKGQKLND